MFLGLNFKRLWYDGGVCEANSTSVLDLYVRVEMKKNRFHLGSLTKLYVTVAFSLSSESTRSPHVGCTAKDASPSQKKSSQKLRRSIK